MIGRDLEQALPGYLRPAEHLRWTGRPVQGLRLYARDALLIPFSLLWGGFSIYWERDVLSVPAPGFFILWGVPFVLAGLYLIIGRFFVDAWVRGRTVYAVTDQRILVLRRVFSEKLISCGLDQPMRLQKERDGRGTVEFGDPRPITSFGRRRGGGWDIWTPALDNQVCLIGVENVMSVYQVLGRTAPA